MIYAYDLLVYSYKPQDRSVWDAFLSLLAFGRMKKILYFEYTDSSMKKGNAVW